MKHENRQNKKSINYLKELEIKYGIATCITNQNISNLKEMVIYCQQIGAESLKLSLYDGDNPIYQLTENQIHDLEDFVKNVNSEKVYIRYSPLKETLNYISKFPDIRIYPNGDIGIDKTKELIGNINSEDPAVLYAKYLKQLTKES